MRSQQVVAQHLPHVRHHQLFLAGMHVKRVAKPPTIERRRGAKGRPLKAAPPPVAAPRVAWVQLTVLDDNDIRRAYRRRRVALGERPVSATWILNLRGLRGTLERLRIDHQLEEAIASGADPLHLAAVFGISDTTAVRYALNAGPHAAPPSSP